MQRINSTWTKQCLRANPGSWRGIGEWGQLKWEFSGKSQWQLLEQINTGWICHCIPSLPWKCSCNTGRKQIVGFDLFISGGSIKSALGVRQQEQKSALKGKGLPSASSALGKGTEQLKRGEKRFYFSVRWNDCLAILNACKYIFLSFIKGVSSDLLKRECFGKKWDKSINNWNCFYGGNPSKCSVFFCFY